MHLAALLIAAQFVTVCLPASSSELDLDEVDIGRALSAEGNCELQDETGSCLNLLQRGHARTKQASSAKPLGHAGHNVSTDINSIFYFSVPCAAVLSFWSVLLYRFYCSFRESSMAAGEDFHPSFMEYVHYRVAHWFEETESAKAILLLSACTFFTLVCAAIYHVMSGLNWGMATFYIFSWLTKARPIDDQKAALFIGPIVGTFGLIAFALLVALVQSVANGWLDKLKAGSSPVVESGHVLIIGFTEDTITLIRELCHRSEHQGGIAIVIMCRESKIEVEQDIQKACIDLKGSRVIVRKGNPQKRAELEHVAAHLCSIIVIMPKRTLSKELRDSLVLQNLMVLCSNGFPASGWILTVCSLERNRPIFEQFGGPQVEIVHLDQFFSSLLVSCSHEVGQGTITKSMYGHRDSELYVTPVPKACVGRTFKELAAFYPNCIPVGIVPDGEGSAILSPVLDRQLFCGDSLVLYAKDDTCIEALEEARLPQSALSLQVAKKAASQLPACEAETILFFGWNESAGQMLLEIDAEVAPGARVQFFASKDVETRKDFLNRTQLRFASKFKNIEIGHVTGTLGSRYQLEELPIKVEEASRMFILADESLSNQEHADACTVTVLLQLRDILLRSGRVATVPIVPEILLEATESNLHNIGIGDVVNSQTAHGEIISNVCQARALKQVYFDLIHANGRHQVLIRSLRFYTDDEIPTMLSFSDLMPIISSTGDVLIGWSKLQSHDDDDRFSLESIQSQSPCESASPHPQTPQGKAKLFRQRTQPYLGGRQAWELNPADRETPRAWDVDIDKIVVIVRHDVPKGVVPQSYGC